MSRTLFVAWIILSLLGLTHVAVAAAGAAPAADPGSRELLFASLSYADRQWDESAGLLRSPVPEEAGRHRTRESAWYALGLLMRNQPGDEARAVRIIERVLVHQIEAPGERWDGTFRRFPDEPAPGPGAKLWQDFDPNWRHFIGTTFALILTEFETRLPAGLPARLEDSIRRAVEGELTQGRVEPYHTNIKLMHGFLWSWAGARLNRPEWIAGGERWAEEVAAAFAVHETFEEYNSPTYYGVDFYGLALMRRHGATPRIRELGARLEAGLWRDVGRFYHAGLKNMAGPFDRAYGMDMRRYVSLTGIWMRLVLPADLTPLPDPSGPMGHAHDFFATPLYVVLGAMVPADVLVHFRAFQGECQIERVITTERTATAWLSRDLMLGGERTNRTFAATPGVNQLHPATAHWRVGASDIGWFVLRQCPGVDAVAELNRLSITTVPGDSTFRFTAPGLDPAGLTRERWTLPNLTVEIGTDATGFTVTPGNGFVDVQYRAATRIALRTAYQP